MSQAVIQSLESIIVDLPTIRPHKLAMHTMNRQTLVILRLRCSDGIEGLGEATTIGGLAYGSESPESIKSNLDAHFAPLLLGQPADNVNAAMQRLDRHIRGNTFARSAVETALLDAHGKRLGLAVSELLGGRLHDSLEVAWTLASGDTGRDIEEAERMLDLRRHRHFKLKIGAGEVDADVAHAIAIKRALGERASVRVDVNQAWDEGVAQRACTTLGDNGIAHGGPRAVLRSAAIAEAAGIGLYGGTMLEGGIGTLAAAHAFVTLDRLAWHSELFGPLLLTEDILLESPRYQDFHLHVPRAPGLGLALDEERLARFRRR